MAPNMDKACGELFTRVRGLCEAAKTARLSSDEQARLRAAVWAFALAISDSWLGPEHGASPGAVIVSRLVSREGAPIEPQADPIESGFDIVLGSSERYDLLATMQRLWAMMQPDKRP